MYNKYMKKQAFTLIELLVVIAIIGILATVIAANITDTRRDAVDANRISTVRSAGLAYKVEQRIEDDLYPAFADLTTIAVADVSAMSGITINPTSASTTYCVSYALTKPELGKEIFISNQLYTGYRSTAEGGC